MLNRGWGYLFMMALLAVALLPATSAAGEPVSCGRDAALNPVTGRCVVSVSLRRAARPNPGASGTARGVASSTSPGCRSPYSGEAIPCRTSEGWWSDSRGCYIKLLSPQPPKSAAVWQGRTEGAIYECRVDAIVGTGIVQVWSLTPPAGPADPPDPAVLAAQAVAAMRLRAVTIGIVPEALAGRVGLVGMPTWMWVVDPSASSWGPISRSVSAAGFKVTATGRVQRVVWAMGDGSTVVCRSAGTPYADSFGRRSSPDCGYTFTRQGTYTVRATSYWRVRWAGMGQTGEIPLQFSRSAVITVGEAQVLTTG